MLLQPGLRGHWPDPYAGLPAGLGSAAATMDTATAVAGLTAAALGACLSGRILSGTPPSAGCSLPDATLFTMRKNEKGELKNEKVTTSELFAAGKTVVLFALPGAFTPG